MQLTEKQLQVMELNGHLLVTGGPGSGKTTISILKASQIAKNHLRPNQQILFLSFARASVSRVTEAIEYEQKIPSTQKKRINVETYHSFFWRIIKTHGYLIGLPRQLEILLPSNESIALSEIRAKFPKRPHTDEQNTAKKSTEQTERIRLAIKEGKVCFDLFATYASDILYGSSRVRHLIATMYPVIIFDEFQDTNDQQWRVVQALGEFCQLIALADPEQRIYDWIGANPARLEHFRKTFNPVEVDLSADNHRSPNVEIALFGNDLLNSNFRQNPYKGVSINYFDSFPAPAMTKLVTEVYAARQRLIEQKVDNWSLAILVPTKKLTRLVSDFLRQPPARMKAVAHVAVIEMDAAILAVEIVGLLLQPSGRKNHFEQFITLICNYFQGKNGDTPTQIALKEAANIRKSYEELLVSQNNGNALRKNSILVNMLTVYNQICALELTGIPEEDWRSIGRTMENGACKRLKEIADEVKNIRLLERGTQLRQQLSQDWRDSQYGNALSIIRQAFVQEHLSMTAKPETGVVVMNMHKAKGKQFDEVIIFEGWPQRVRREIVANPDRIVRFNSKEEINDQARQNLRVSVTRGRQKVTILTPSDDPCILLPKL
ncbi:TPA: UvrD-helicase domain-containing protein [Legionella pneumophila]